MINYDLSLIRAIIFDIDGVLSHNTVTVAPSGLPVRTANIKDGYALQFAVKKGLHLCIITGATEPSLRLRYEGLGLQEIHTGASHKLSVYEDWKQRLALRDEEVIYVGDDIPDLPVLEKVGCPCCPSDACHEVKEVSTYISPYAGGDGVARDIIEQVLRAKGEWLNDPQAFAW